MSIDNIVLFLSPYNQYGVINHFTKKLAEAFEQLNIKTRVLDSNWSDPRPFLEQLLNDRPNFTLSFNGLLPDEKGNFLSEMIKIPHVACLVDGPGCFLQLIKSPRTIIGNIDRDFNNFFSRFPQTHSIFFPHGVEASLLDQPVADRFEHEVIFLGSCFDIDAMRENWKERFSSNIVKCLEEAAENTLNDPALSYYQALVHEVDKSVKKDQLDPRNLNFQDLLMTLEKYVKGRDRISLLKSIDDAFSVHLYGSKEGKGWEYYLKDKKNIHIHPPVDFSESIRLMRSAKITLNSSIFKNGSHERALIPGTAVLTNRNQFLSETFEDRNSILFFDYGNADQINQMLNFYLSNESARLQIVHNAREVIRNHHTWEHRAKKLIHELPPILNSLP